MTETERADFIADDIDDVASDESELAASEVSLLKLGQIPDYITGTAVKATPEEIEAVQVMARRLVEDYGYPRDLIQTHPQFRVRKFPADVKKSYPVDIAVFRTQRKTEDNLFLVVG